MLKISVVMPVYNGEKYLREAIESILNQTLMDFEFIIINDGSVDGSEDIIKSYNDSRIIYLKNEENKGIVYSLNCGIDRSKGKYIARMDCDDISLPERFQKQYDYMEKYPNIGVLGTSCIIFGDGTNVHKFEFASNPHQAKANMFFNSCLAHPSVFIRKEILNRYHIKYEQEFAGKEDYRMWWKVSRVADVMSLNSPLLKYRQHANQVTKQRDEASLQKTKTFLRDRLDELEIDLNEDEQDILVQYIVGNFQGVNEEKVRFFIDVLCKCADANAKVKVYSVKHLIHTFELAVLWISKQSGIDTCAYDRCYDYARQNKIITNITAFKVWVHNVLRF